MRKVITIAREFGAGGGEIGRKVAKELGIQFYDKDIILRTALANPKLDPEDVRRWDERVPSSFGFAQSLFDFYNKPVSYTHLDVYKRQSHFWGSIWDIWDIWQRSRSRILCRHWID